MITIQEYTIEAPSTGEILTLWKVSYNDLMEIRTDTWHAIRDGLAELCQTQGFIFTPEDDDTAEHQPALFIEPESDSERLEQP